MEGGVGVSLQSVKLIDDNHRLSPASNGCRDILSYRHDLEFCSVAVDKIDSLSPSHHPPRAYMGHVAER